MEAATPTRIDLFRGEYAWLSSFSFKFALTRNAVTFRTREHAFQYEKTFHAVQSVDPELIAKLQSAIVGAASPVIAKRLGRRVPLDVVAWNQVRVPLMQDLIRQQVAQHPELAALLLATGSATLVEGNQHNDRFWGVCRGRGENWLGRSWELIRQELQRRSQ